MEPMRIDMFIKGLHPLLKSWVETAILDTLERAIDVDTKRERKPYKTLRLKLHRAY